MKKNVQKNELCINLIKLFMYISVPVELFYVATLSHFEFNTQISTVYIPS